MEEQSVAWMDILMVVMTAEMRDLSWVDPLVD